MKGLISIRKRHAAMLVWLLGYSIGSAAASPSLPAIIEQALQQQHPGSGITFNVSLITPSHLLPTCPTPELTLQNQGRLSGKMSVAARCDNRRRFIQITVDASGAYWTAARSVKANTLLTKADVVRKKGPLNGLPGGIILADKNIIGRVSSRTINAGQPIIKSQLKTAWKVTTGSRVEIVSIGAGFRVRSQGKALDNGAVNDTIRLRTDAGQLLTGRVDAGGGVKIDF